MTPIKYRRKPSFVEAVQFDGSVDNAMDIIRWIMSKGGTAYFQPALTSLNGLVGIDTEEGLQHAASGDYILCRDVVSATDTLVFGTRAREVCSHESRFKVCAEPFFQDTYELPLILSSENYEIIRDAFEDGCGQGLTLEATLDPPWFKGTYEDSTLYYGMEHEGTLYSIVRVDNNGSQTVLVGGNLGTNEVAPVFAGVDEAKTYVRNLVSK